MAFNLAVPEKYSGDPALEEQAQQHLAFPKGLRRIHQQEYGTFLSVQGRLALVEGKPQGAGKLLKLVGQVSGQERAARHRPTSCLSRLSFSRQIRRTSQRRSTGGPC
ncbi:hypothetical protein GCM10022631_14650 [Deinococcus rubellus]|uniref:Uncharacterized protein n=1 Tax=Deinococcus rubellus TaxID=1889240 RepID=A0ABY5YIJ3_9DEIO|nr:hypothetical protein [Deinococcus rubellus]UWX64935.1 hypothetical protein N0D28_04545 [Deinococcus rubellus]